MIEHHFIIKYSKENGWEWDTDSEAIRYSDGTVWNSESNEWSNGYAGWNKDMGEAEYVDDDDLIGEQLSKGLFMLNDMKEIEV